MKKNIPLSAKLYLLTTVFIICLLMMSMSSQWVEKKVAPYYAPVTEGQTSEIPEGHQEIIINKGTALLRFVTDDSDIISKIEFLEKMYVFTPVLAVLFAISAIASGTVAMKEKDKKNNYKKPVRKKK